MSPTAHPPDGYAQGVLLALSVLFGAYLGLEVWRWRAGNRAQLTAGQFRRRLAGGILLEADLLLWLLADPLTAGRSAAERLLYLLVATLLVLIPLLLAVREAAFVLRQYARWRAELLRGLARPEEGELPRRQD